MKKFSCDFETCTWLEDETYVWAWAKCEIGNIENIEIGNSIESFIENISKESGMYYFQNLKFDGEFIICYLLSHGYEHVRTKEEIKENTFTTLISDMGMFYSIEIYFKKGNKKEVKATIYDGLKIIPMSVDKMSKAFGLPINKLDLDYNLEREKGHILTDEEEAYLKNDVKIPALALEKMFSENLTKMTIGSNALSYFKKKTGMRTFSRLFPKIERDLYEELKKSYRGGFTYLNPIYKEVENGATVNLDVNSLYPYCMRYKPLCYGDPIHYEGEYQVDNIYPLYIQKIFCSFEIKKDKIPTIQIKKTMYFQDNEYLESSKGEIVPLMLTSIDLKLFLENYNVTYIKYEEGYKFKAKNGIFDEYIDYWIGIKNEATKTGNKGLRQIAKLMLNSLYGKFASKMRVQEKIPYLEDGKVLYKLDEEKEKEGIYLPLGAFITSYAREITIRTSGAIKEYSLNKYGKDMYIYSDTDSIKTTLPLEELKQFCEIDDVKLGAWKYEGTAIRSKFVRQKTYLEEIINDKGEKEMVITCAGMPDRCFKYVEWDTFKEGFTCGGKLTFKHVRGGAKLVETNFTIKTDRTKRNIKTF